MRSPAHLPTLRGLGPDEDEISDDDIVEVDGERPSQSGARYAMVTVPPRGPARPSGAYSMFPARSKQTLRGGGEK